MEKIKLRLMNPKLQIMRQHNTDFILSNHQIIIRKANVFYIPDSLFSALLRALLISFIISSSLQKITESKLSSPPFGE